MKHEDKADYFRIALALVGIPVDDKTADLVTRTWEEVSKKKGKFAIDDAVNVKFTHDKYWIDKELREKKEKGEK